jgi:hypothetical protein
MLAVLRLVVVCSSEAAAQAEACSRHGDPGVAKGAPRARHAPQDADQVGDRGSHGDTPSVVEQQGTNEH